MSNEVEPKYSKKSVKAISSWNVVNSEVEDIEKHLKTLYENLLKIVNNEVVFTNDPSRSENYQEEKGKIEAIDKNPTNLWTICFSWLGVEMNIDFRISTSDLSKDSELVGCVIYSATRRRINGYQRLKKSEYTLFSYDKKPFISVLVDPDGRVTAPGAFEEEWWVYSDSKTPSEYHYEELAAEIHYMVRDKIWKRALFWRDEGVLP